MSGRHGCGFFGVTERMSFVLFLFLFGEDGVFFWGGDFDFDFWTLLPMATCRFTCICGRRTGKWSGSYFLVLGVCSTSAKTDPIHSTGLGFFLRFGR